MNVPRPFRRASGGVARVRADAGPDRVTDLDGVRVDLDDGWYHVRVSHTEPVIRIHCEAASEEAAEELVMTLRQQVLAALAGVT